MPAATRQRDRCTEHDACPPFLQVECRADVNIVAPDALGITTRSTGCVAHSGYSDYIDAGSSTENINGRSAGRIGDSVSIGGTV